MTSDCIQAHAAAASLLPQAAGWLAGFRCSKFICFDLGETLEVVSAMYLSGSPVVVNERVTLKSKTRRSTELLSAVAV